MSTSTTTKMAGTTLPQLKSGVPLPPVDLDSEEVLGGEESDEALSSDEEDEIDDDDDDDEDDEQDLQTHVLTSAPADEDDDEDAGDTSFVPSSPPNRKRNRDAGDALAHAAKRLKVAAPAQPGTSLPAVPLVVGPSDEWLAARKEQLAAERAAAAEKEDVAMEGEGA